MTRGLTFLIALWVAGFTNIGDAHGQDCQPYWTGMPVPQTPDQSTVIFHPLVTTNGPELFASSVLGYNRIYRWELSQWIEVPRGSIPSEEKVFRLNSLDGGDGRHLYLLTSRNGPDRARNGYSSMRSYKLVNDTWTSMPAAFWRGQFEGPYLSANFGEGMRIYGVHYPGGASKWNGAAWQSLGLESTIESPHLEAENDGSGLSLFAFGGVWSLNGQTAYGFAKWSASAWSIPFTGATVASYTDYPSTCAVTFDDGTGPKMYTIRGPRYNPFSINFPVLYRWHNNQWTTIGLPVGGPNTFTGARQMCIFDDGRGPAIYVSGSFENVNGIPARCIARWDGHTWEALGAGLTTESAGNFNYLGVVNDASGSGLVVVGEGVFGAGGGLSRRAVKWVGCPNCYANCDLSTGPDKLNANDFVCFISKFAAKDPYANCTVDAAINAADFACFLDKFAAGCP